MAKPVVGVYFGELFLNVVVYEENVLEVVASKKLEKPLSEIMSGQEYDLLVSALAPVVAEEKLKGESCVLALPRYSVALRRMQLAGMSEEQLKFTIHGEFRDFTRDIDQEYIYDYMLVNKVEMQEGVPIGMDVVAAAVQRTTVESFEQVIHKSGLKVWATIPEEAAYGNIIKHYLESNKDNTETDFCILNLGLHSANLFIFSGYGFEVAKAIEYPEIEEEIANNVSLEVMKSINFYGFSKRDSEIYRIYYAGRGAFRGDVLDATEAATGKRTVSIEKLMPQAGDSPENLEQLLLCTAAAGAALQ